MANIGTRRRVKLYMLNDDRQWDDKGTGHVSAAMNEHDSLSLVVLSEIDGSSLLDSKIAKDTAYQKQQETLIVWSERDNIDLALSFQEKIGCDEIWEKICVVQGKDPSVEITQDVEDSDDVDDEELLENANILNAAAAAGLGGGSGASGSNASSGSASSVNSILSNVGINLAGGGSGMLSNNAANTDNGLKGFNMNNNGGLDRGGSSLMMTSSSVNSSSGITIYSSGGGGGGFHNYHAHHLHAHTHAQHHNHHSHHPHNNRLGCEFPECDIEHLEDIEKLISSALLQMNQKREQIVIALERSGFIRDLCALFRKLDSVQELEPLSHIYNIVRGIIQFDKLSLYETLFHPDTLDDVIGMLEYNHQRRYNHRKFLAASTFNQPYDFGNAHLVSKIHQIYKIQFVQDCCLPPPTFFEESMYPGLNNYIIHIKRDIVNTIIKDECALRNLIQQLMFAVDDYAYEAASNKKATPKKSKIETAMTSTSSTTCLKKSFDKNQTECKGGGVDKEDDNMNISMDMMINDVSMDISNCDEDATDGNDNLKKKNSTEESRNAEKDDENCNNADATTVESLDDKKAAADNAGNDQIPDKLSKKATTTPNGGAKKKTATDRVRNLIRFIHEFCQLSGSLGPEQKEHFYPTLIHHGLLTVLKTVMQRRFLKCDAIRSASLDILQIFIENQTNMVREFIHMENRELSDQSDKAVNNLFVNVMIDVLMSDEDRELNDALIIINLIRILLDPETMTGVALPGSRIEKCDFLSCFYKRSIANLIRPIIEIREATNAENSCSNSAVRASVAPPVSTAASSSWWCVFSQKLDQDNYQRALLLNHIIEMIIFCFENHTFHIRNFSYNNDVIFQQILLLLHSRHTFLVLTALRFFRRIVGLKEEFYARMLIKIKTFQAIFDLLTRKNPPLPSLAVPTLNSSVNSSVVSESATLTARVYRYNMINSAVFEFFEYVASDGVFSLVKHLLEKFSNRLASATEYGYSLTLRNVKVRYANGPSGNGTSGAIAAIGAIGAAGSMADMLSLPLSSSAAVGSSLVGSASTSALSSLSGVSGSANSAAAAMIAAGAGNLGAAAAFASGGTISNFLSDYHNHHQQQQQQHLNTSSSGNSSFSIAAASGGGGSLPQIVTGDLTTSSSHQQHQNSQQQSLNHSNVIGSRRSAGMKLSDEEQWFDQDDDEEEEEEDDDETGDVMDLNFPAASATSSTSTCAATNSSNSLNNSSNQISSSNNSESNFSSSQNLQRLNSLTSTFMQENSVGGAGNSGTLKRSFGVISSSCGVSIAAGNSVNPVSFSNKSEATSCLSGSSSALFTDNFSKEDIVASCIEDLKQIEDGEGDADNGNIDDNDDSTEKPNNEKEKHKLDDTEKTSEKIHKLLEKQENEKNDFEAANSLPQRPRISFNLKHPMSSLVSIPSSSSSFSSSSTSFSNSTITTTTVLSPGNVASPISAFSSCLTSSSSFSSSSSSANQIASFSSTPTEKVTTPAAASNQKSQTATTHSKQNKSTSSASSSSPLSSISANNESKITTTNQPVILSLSSTTISSSSTVKSLNTNNQTPISTSEEQSIGEAAVSCKKRARMTPTLVDYSIDDDEADEFGEMDWQNDKKEKNIVAQENESNKINEILMPSKETESREDKHEKEEVENKLATSEEREKTELKSETRNGVKSSNHLSTLICRETCDGIPEIGIELQKQTEEKA